MPISSAALAALAAGAAAATIIDIRTRRIPNTLTATLAGAGLGMAALGVSNVPLAASIAGLLAGLALMLPGHLLGATGAGDVKFMGAVGAVIGVGTIVTAFLFTALAGGVLAVAVAAQRRRLAVTVSGAGRLMTLSAGARGDVRTAAPARRFAYGPAIAIGSLLAVVAG